MPSNHVRHYGVALNSAIEQRTRVGFDQERNAEMNQREADERFVRKVLVAIWRGDNIPAGQARPVRPLVLTP